MPEPQSCSCSYVAFKTKTITVGLNLEVKHCYFLSLVKIESLLHHSMFEQCNLHGQV